MAYSKPESYVVKVEAESLLAGSGKHGGTGGHEDAEDDNDEGQGTSAQAGTCLPQTMASLLPKMPVSSK